METFKLEGQIRSKLGKTASSTVRKEDLVPCVLYGSEGNINFTVDYNKLKKVIYTDKFVIAEISVGGKEVKAIVKEIQFHPVTDRMLHIDFQQLIDGQRVKTEIPIVLKGFAKGQQAGGKLELKVRKLKVKADSKSIPSKIEVDITNLEMGKSLRVRDIKVDGVDIITSGAIPVATVSIPRALRGAAAEAK